jgi:hypothetical protein
VIMADRRLQEAANKHARGLLGNPVVKDAESAPPSNPAAAPVAPAAPVKPTNSMGGTRSNESLIAAGMAKNPGASREEIISLIKKAGKWQ